MAPLRCSNSRLWRYLRRGAVSLCVLLTVVAVAGTPVYVWPQVDQPRHADAIFILGGYGDRRYPFGLNLAMEGWASDLVVSNPIGPNDQWDRDYCTSPPPRLRMHCFTPDPPTTRGEALELRRLSQRHGWRTVIVVTFRPHISRARYILERCFDGDLVMVASPARVSPVRWTFEYVYQTAGYLRAALRPGC